ncbi:MAG TPA: hypothetical protein VF993_03620 [Myxococcales bacterium]
MKRFLPFLCGASAWLIFVLPVLDPSMTLYYRDTGRLYYPVKRYIADRLLRGELPLWDPWTEAGASILGQTTPGLFHPFTLLYLAFPFDLAFKLNHLLPLLLAGISAWLLARQLGATSWAALAAGAVYGGSGYLVAQSAANLPYALGPATMPLAIALFLRYLDRPSAARLFWAGLVLGSCELAGDPQSMLLAGLIGSAFAVARDLLGAQPGARWQRAGKTSLRIAAWGASALLLAAPAAAPSAAELLRSSRTSGPSELERSFFFVVPARLAGLLVPRAFDDTPEEYGPAASHAWQAPPFREYLSSETVSFADSIFLGPAALLLALWAVLSGRKGRFFLLGALILLCAAAGEALGVAEVLNHLIPGLRFFRYAEKLMGAASLLLAVCAALGADAAFAGRRRAAWFAAQAGLLAAAMAGSSALLGRNHAAFESWVAAQGREHIAAVAPVFLQAIREGLWSGALLAMPLALCALACAARPLPLRAGPALAAICCLAAPFAATAGLLHIAPMEMMHQPPILAEEMLKQAGPSPGRWRYYVDPRLVPVLRSFDDRTGAMLAARVMLQPQFETLFSVEGAAPYFSAVDDQYTAALYASLEPVFRVLRVRFAVYGLWELSAAEAARRKMKRIDPGFWAAEFPQQPEASLLAVTSVAPGTGAALGRLRDPAFNPRREAILLQGAGARALDAGPFPHGQGSLAMKDLSPERLRIDLDAPHDAFLLTSTHFNPGWRATIDGAPAPVLRSDLVVNGLFVPAGRHLVELRYWPVGFTAGLLAFAATLAGFIVLLAVDRRRQIPARR